MPQAAATARAKDGCQLSYRVYPNPQKPRVALIHSLALSGAMWDEMIGILGSSAEILAYDCRGHGSSERPKSVSELARDQAAEGEPSDWGEVVTR